MAKSRPLQTIETVEGNTAPPLVLTCQRQGVAINLSGCTVALVIAQNNTTITNIGHQGCTVTDSLNGIITYVRQTGDISTAGNYFCDIVVTYGDGTIETLWTQVKLVVGKKSGSTT